MIVLLFAACGGSPTDTAGDTAADPDGFEALAGLVFVQEALGVGAGSYTFAAEDDLYIDYSAAPSSWTRDDGSALPAHEPFLQPSFGGVRTFSAVVDWSDGATVSGDAEWDYVMVFDEGYTTIESGTCERFGPDGEHDGTLEFGVDLVYTRAE